MTSSSHDYTMSRVKLKFPAKAYPSQVQMMNQIIRALQKGQNALLESPTGSGKSLALLCAALAWQQEEAKRAKEYNEAIESGLMEPEMILVDENDEEITDPRVLERVRQEASEPGAGGGFLPQVDNDDDDFVSTSPPRKKVRTEDEERTAPKPPAPKMPLATTRRAKRKVVPKIFFGTRTHKQISQIIRELNKTVYKDSLKMTILGSREHTCIHPTVSKLKNKNEGCKEQNDSSKGMSCSYRQNGKQRLSTHEALGSYRYTSNYLWWKPFVEPYILGFRISANRPILLFGQL